MKDGRGKGKKWCEWVLDTVVAGGNGNEARRRKGGEVHIAGVAKGGRRQPSCSATE